MELLDSEQTLIHFALAVETTHGSLKRTARRIIFLLYPFPFLTER